MRASRVGLIKDDVTTTYFIHCDEGKEHFDFNALMTFLKNKNVLDRFTRKDMISIDVWNQDFLKLLPHDFVSCFRMYDFRVYISKNGSIAVKYLGTNCDFNPMEKMFSHIWVAFLYEYTNYSRKDLLCPFKSIKSFIVKIIVTEQSNDKEKILKKLKQEKYSVSNYKQENKTEKIQTFRKDNPFKESPVYEFSFKRNNYNVFGKLCSRKIVFHVSKLENYEDLKYFIDDIFFKE